MLNRVIRFSLKYRPFILVLCLVALVYGGYVTTQLPIDVFPDLDRPRVVVMTEVPGLAPEDVEALVTFPLESSLLGATGVQAVRSQSGVGLSVVYVEFDWSTNIYLARQTVQERLGTAAPSLPAGTRPQMAPVSSIMGQIIHIGLSRGASESDGPQLELRTLADWVIRPRLLKIPGVSQVVVMGGGRKQYQVLLNPNALLEHNVTLKEVEDALRANNLNASGGFHIAGEKEQAIRVLGRLGPTPAAALEQIAAVPVKHAGGRSVQVRHVARVVEAAQLKRGDASVNGQPAVILTVTKQPHVDTLLVTDEVKAALAELQPGLPRDVTVHTDLFQLKHFIETGIYNVAEALVLGACLVVLILFLFLLNFRTTFISLTAIPLSLALTALTFKLVSWFTGTPLSLNVMTLGGIAVALGELVDDAIVDVENIFRRLKENAHLPSPRPVLRVVYEASVEIRGAIVFGTIMVILVFIPLFALSGIEGRLFTPLGIAYIVSILASLLVSLTLTPVLSYYLLPQAKAVQREQDSLLLRWLKFAASGLIRLSLGWAGTLLLATWILVGVSFWVLTQLGTDFLPPFDEGSVQVNLSLPAGSSLTASNNMSRMADTVFRDLLRTEEHPGRPILTFSRRSGRAELDEHAEPVGNTEYILTTNPESGQPRDVVIQSILDQLRDGVPGVQVEVEQPLAHLISHMLSGVTAQIAIKIYGDDLDLLRQAAEMARARLSGVPGVASLAVEAQRQVDEVHIRLKSEQLTYYGLDRAYVAEFVAAALRGEALTEIFEGQRRFELIVWLDEPFRRNVQSLGRLRLTLPNGRGEVPLAELAEVTTGSGPNVINRENARRRIVLRCNALGRDLGSVVNDIRARLGDIQTEPAWPSGYFLEYGGQFESQRRATLLIALLGGVALVGMFAVLYMHYPSTRVVLQILNAIPAAFIGGVLALALTGQTLTVASMVGFISLGGIAARNGILLVSHYFHLMTHEGEGFTRTMVVRGSLERLAPVLMTALTAGIALVPLVVVGQKPGREILYPVATVILGGLITSTLCEYLLHPGLFWRFSGKDAIRLAERAEDELGPVRVTPTATPHAGREEPRIPKEVES